MPGDFGIDALSREDIVQVVETFSRLRADSKALRDIEKAATSCVRWGRILGELLESPNPLYIRPPEGVRLEIPFQQIREELQNGKAVIIGVLLPKLEEASNHVFTIEPQGDGKARVLHAWEGDHPLQPHPLQPEDHLPIDEVVSLLRNLELDMTPENLGRIKDAQGKLWGKQHEKPGEFVATSGRKKNSFTSIVSGKPRHELKFRESVNGLSRELVGFSEEFKPLIEKPLTNPPPQGSKMRVVVRSAAVGGAVGAGLGLVFGAAGVLIFDKSDDKYKNAAIEGGKGALAGGAGGIAGGAAAKAFRPMLPGMGVSVVRANALAGAAMFTVLAVWDVGAWATKNITTVEMRKRFAANIPGTLAGVAGGAAAGAATGAVAGIWLGPVGAGICGIVGGIVGGVATGVAGAFAGMAIDKAIWSADEDAIMNCYEFFGWRIKRNNHVEKTGEEIADAYHKKLGKKPKKFKEQEAWVLYCTTQLMILLKAMYPEYVKLLEIAGNLKASVNESENDGIRIISTIMFSSLHHQDG